MSSPDPASPHDFGRLCALAREARLAAIRARFPPWCVRFNQDYGLEVVFSLVGLAMSLLLLSVFVFFPSTFLFGCVPVVELVCSWLFWSGFVCMVASIVLMQLLDTIVWMWERLHPNDPFLSCAVRLSALRAAADPVAVTRAALETRLTLVRVEAERLVVVPWSAYRVVSDPVQDCADFISGLESLAAALSDQRRHVCVGERVLVRVADSLHPDGEPPVVSIEDRYAELARRYLFSR